MDINDNAMKIKVYRMTYSEVEEVTEDVLFCKNDKGDIEVRKLDGSILDKLSADSQGQAIYHFGSFILHLYDEMNPVLTNYRTNKTLNLPKHTYGRSLGDSFVWIEYCDRYNQFNSTKCIILNERLEIVCELTGVSYKRISSETATKLVVNILEYNSHENRGANAFRNIVLNKQTGNVDSYHSVDFEKGYGMVATETEKVGHRWYSFNDDASGQFRYKLSYNGQIIGKKSHTDIIKPLSLSNTDYFITIETTNEYDKLYYGLIDNTGEEIIDAECKSIDGIGGNLVIVDKGGKCEIYDLVYRRYVPIYSNIDSWSIHESLPLTQLNMADGSILLVDTKRHIFRPEEFTNYFRCLLNNDFPNVIKVALNEYIEKFVTYTLNPITEINQIGKYKASNAWYEFTNQKV